MPALVAKYDAAHPPPQGYGRVFELIIPAAAAADDVAEEEAEEDEDDVVAAAGNMTEAAIPGPGSSSARRRRSDTAAKQTLPKRRRSTRQSASTDGHSVIVHEGESNDNIPLSLRPHRPAACAPSVTVVSASVSSVVPLFSSGMADDDLFSMPLPDFTFSEVVGDLKKVIKPSEDVTSSLALDAGKSLQESVAASSPRVVSPEPCAEERNVGSLVSYQEEHRAVDSPSGVFAVARLPPGSFLLDSLEAAARVDEVVGEVSDNHPPPASAADVGRPSTSGPTTLLLTRSGEEMAQLGRVERLAELVSSWESFSDFFLQALFDDQDLLFGPQEMQSAALIEANLKNAEFELAWVRAELAQEREQRGVMEAALNAKVADAESVRQSALQAVAEAQIENSDLKHDRAALAREKEAWLKEREERVNTLRTSNNIAESAMKSVQDLQGKLTAAQNQFWALYAAVTPVIASVCQREDKELGHGGIIPVLSFRFYDFVKDGFHRCINNVVSYVRVVAPDAPLE